MQILISHFLNLVSYILIFNNHILIYISIMSNDGLSNTEKVNLLFKNYMNFTSTLDSKAFFEETALANNTNIFSTSVLSSTPSTSPNFNTTIGNASDLSTLLVNAGITNISIDDTWFTSKTTDGGSFKKTSDNVTLRLDTIKLDYITNGGASFICKDNNGVNILQNLIPSNYAGSGYSLSLGYKTGGSIKSVPWLTARGTLGSILGTTVNFGGALFDSKNGVVTFYDVNGTPSSIFGSAEFYLTATKYIGPKGITSAPSLDVAGNASFNADASVTNDLTVGGDTTITGNLVVTGSTTTVHSNTLDISDNATIDGTLIVKSDISLNGSMNTDGGAIIQGSVGIGTDSAPVKVTINSTDAIKIPVGNNAQRPTGQYGYIRYNSENSSYEGFGAGNAWGSLGGVKDVDQDTYITAEDSAGANNNELKFITANSEKMRINSNGNVGIGTNNPSAKLDVNGDLLVKGSGTVDNDLHIKRHLTVDGSINFLGNFIQRDTIINVTEQMDLSNDGTGPSLIVRQHGAQPVATFYDDETLSMIIKDGGDVSFNNSVCILQDLSVNGNVSVTGGHGGTIAGAILTGTTAQRPSGPTSGTIRYNTTIDKPEIYTTFWLSIPTGAQIDQVDASVNRLYANSDLDPEIITFDDDNFIHITKNVSEPDNVFRLSNNFEVSGNIINKGTTTLNKDLFVKADISLNDHLVVGKTSTFDGKIIAKNDISLNNNLYVNGDVSFNNNVYIKENLTVDGSINFTGDFIKTDTIVRITEQMDVSNTGTGPALIVRQHGNEDIAKFYDDTTLAVDIKNGGNVDFHEQVYIEKFLTTDNEIRAAKDSNITSYFGKAAVGWNNQDNDWASFAHLDSNNGTDYAILQSTDGTTYVNSANNKIIHFKHNDTTRMVLNNGNLGINDTNPSAKLHVNGTTKITGDASFNSGLSIDGNFNVEQNATVTGKLIAQSDISLNGPLNVNGATIVNNNLTVTGDVSLNTGLSVDGNLNIDGNTVHTGVTLMNDTVTITAPLNNTGDFTLVGHLLSSGGDVSLNGKLFATGDVSFNQSLIVDGASEIRNTLRTTGDASFNSGLSIDGNLNVDQAATISGIFVAQDDASFNSNLYVKNNLTVDGSINFTGNFIKTDTIVRVTEQIDISNTGTGPALTVRQHGNQPIAEFYDDLQISVVFENGGDVSFNENMRIGKNITIDNNIINNGIITQF